MSAAQAEAAGSFGDDVAVSAAAGSGKTSVLVRRFVKAVVERGAVPGEILAVTFTDKAANSMKERLVAEFEKLGRTDDRRALETAYIGTLHSFCLRLLRENPIEAEIDPYFGVLSEGESDLVMTRALDAVFEAQADRPEWLSILSERGEKRVRGAILSLYAQARSTGLPEKLLAVKDHSAARKAAEKALLDHLEEGRALAAAPGGPAKPAANQTAALEAALEVPALLKGPLDLEKFLRVRSLLGIDKRGARMKEWAAHLETLARAWRGPALQAVYAPKKAEFLRVYRQFAETYEREKRALAVLDFDDLPILALSLLGGKRPAQKAVLERYRARFKHVFVDEFQDTNPLQAALVDLLRSKGNLFIVGDARQSIYSFRHAEPALFRRYEESAGKRVPLTENFRSRAAVLEFANSFFAPDGFAPLVPAKKFALEGPGDVEMIRVDYGKDLPLAELEEVRLAEAGLLAARLRELVDGGARVEDGASEGRPMRWGDVAILFRATAQAPLYERALAKAGIPFYSVKSKGFYERPEVKDFVHFLTLLDRPDDDVAMASVLRSPIAGVSDDGLFWLARSVKKDRRDSDPLARALDAPGRAPGISKEDAARAKSFAEFLASVRALKNSLKVSGILDRAADWSGYEAAALTRPGGAQAVANVRKLIEIARSIEEKAAVDAAEFVRYVRALAERDEGGAEARVEAEGGDAVLLMSIHAAKGLEFPVVALANLGGKNPGYGPGFAAASPEEGFGWSEPDPEDEEVSLGDAAHEAVSKALVRRQEEEEDRILYVGMTRAEERLILAGSRSRGGTWIARISDFLDGAGRELPVRRISTAVSAPASPEAESPLSAAADFPDEPLLSRLVQPQKSYDLAIDLTVSDVLADTAGETPSFSEEPEAVDAEDAERSPRNEFGTIFHRLMEAGTLARPRGRVSEEFAASLLSPLTAAEKKEALEGSAAFWKSTHGKEILKSSKTYPELPFIYKTKLGILKGQIDLVYAGPSGWTILDYKTNRITTAQVPQKAAEYEIQLGLYALVFRELYGEMPAKGVLYFSAAGEAYAFDYTPEYLERTAGRLHESLQRLAQAALR